MITSQRGLDLIKQFEGLRLTAYQDSVKTWTVGYGHTGSDVHSLTITRDEAEDLLLQDVKEAEHAVNSLVTHVVLKQGQFDALVDFVFNLGAAALHDSTLLRLVNAREFDNAADQFLRWDHAGGKVLPGLTKRREAERELFLGATG
ncbi:MAG TPA: lysozyme [Edaphobacter sp.]|nr:lysozyme [Edaphobacter sp.]